MAEACLKAGAKSVVAGDGSHLPAFDWSYAVTLDGSTSLVAAAEQLNKSNDGKFTMGFRMGLGEIRKESIEIVGASLDNLTSRWRHATLKG